MLPREGQFHQLLGDLELSEERPQPSLAHYRKAIELNPDYFGSYLGAGIAQFQLGNRSDAEEWLTRSVELLPTAPATYYLGNIERDKGDTEKALHYYQAAAGSNSQFGQMAGAELVRIDLPRNPSSYIATGAQLDAKGTLLFLVENQAPVPVADIQITPVLLDEYGRVSHTGSPIVIREVVNSKQRVSGDAGLGALTSEQAARIRFRVDAARVAESGR